MDVSSKFNRATLRPAGARRCKKFDHRPTDVASEMDLRRKLCPKRGPKIGPISNKKNNQGTHKLGPYNGPRFWSGARAGVATQCRQAQLLKSITVMRCTFARHVSGGNVSRAARLARLTPHLRRRRRNRCNWLLWSVGAADRPVVTATGSKKVAAQ